MKLGALCTLPPAQRAPNPPGRTSFGALFHTSSPDIKHNPVNVITPRRNNLDIQITDLLLRIATLHPSLFTHIATTTLTTSIPDTIQPLPLESEGPSPLLPVAKKLCDYGTPSLISLKQRRRKKEKDLSQNVFQRSRRQGRQRPLRHRRSDRRQGRRQEYGVPPPSSPEQDGAGEVPAVHLALRQHHEPLLRQAQRPAQQADWQGQAQVALRAGIV